MPRFKSFRRFDESSAATENFTEEQKLFFHLIDQQPEKWTLDNGFLNVKGDVRIDALDSVKKLPVKFGRIEGDFIVKNCDDLESLEGFPHTVTQDFWVRHCPKIKSLKGSPDVVGRDVWCSHLSIKTPEGIAQKIGGYLSLDHNDRMISLKGCPSKIRQAFYCDHNKSLRSLMGAPYEFEHRFGSDFDCSGCPLLSQEEMELVDPKNRDLLRLWLKSGLTVEDFMHQKRGLVKGKEFGF